MKIGDRVRFLNAVGGGIVRGRQGKDIVLVEDEDGFEVPVLARECVVVQNAEAFEISLPEEKSLSPSLPAEALPVVEETPDGDELTVALAFLPSDIKKIGSTSFECYLINDSNYYLNVNYLSQSDEDWMLRFSAEVEPNTKIFVEEFEPSQLNDLERICLQFTACKKGKPFRLKPAYSVERRIDTTKFYKLHSFGENDFFDEKAFVINLVANDEPEQGMRVSATQLQEAMMQKDVRLPQSKPLPKAKTAPLLEVDLHITALLDNLSGLSATEMLQYQLAKFNEVMQANIKRKGQKIVFIHGKGNGTLKSVVLAELSKKYKTATVQDASFREYGFGATMVTIR